MITRLYRALGADTDERIVTLICLILACTLPLLFAGAVEALPLPQ